MWIQSKSIPQEFTAKSYKFSKYYRAIKAYNKYYISLNNNNYLPSQYNFIGIQSKIIKSLNLMPFYQYLRISIKKITLKWRYIYLPLRTYYIKTKKPKDIRMGRGKGLPTYRVIYYSKGKSVFKILLNKSKSIAQFYICLKLRKQLPIPSIIIPDW